MKKKKFSELFKNRQAVFCAVLTVFLFSAYIFSVSYFSLDPVRTGILFIIVYILTVFVVCFLHIRLSSHSGAVEDRLVLSRSIFDGVDKMNSPMFICHGDGRIFWCNEGLRSLMSDGRKPYGRTVNELFGVSLDDIRNADEHNGIGIEFSGRYYIANYNSIKFGRGDALITTIEAENVMLLQDELSMFRERIRDRELVVAYILIDNLTEMMQYENESYRPAATKIDELLREWAADVKGIIKEFERDRYLFVFEKNFLDLYIEKKFDVLDRIRDIRVGDEQLPVTVSVGISSITGSLTEKDRSARAALDMALGRGGDQVVVKTDDSTDFYGGRTRSSQKRTGVRARVVSNELLMHMSRASNVLVMGHKYSDYDSLGACVGLARIAVFCGVDVNIVIDPADENFLACRDLLSAVPGYDSGLFISQDEAMDIVQTDTFVVLTDVNNIDISQSPELLESCGAYAVIDHHRKHAEYAREPQLEYIETKASSACELVSEMLEQVLPADFLSAPEANIMLAGIFLDTKQFTRSTGSRTYGAALYLHDLGADPAAVQELFKSGIDSFVKEAEFRSNVIIYKQCMAITVCDGSVDSGGIDKIVASKVADNLINVRGIKAAFAVVRLGKVIHISARSSGEINVQLILEKLRGGGHFDTAGAQIPNVSSDQAIGLLKTAIDEYMDSRKDAPAK